MRTIPERLRLGASLLALAVIAAGACEQPRLISKDKLEQLVLSETDLPAGFASFYKGPQVRLDDQGTARSDPGRFGRQGGWIIRLRQSDPSVTHGLQVIESRADLFPGSDGARSDLDLYRKVLASTSGDGLENIAPPALGDEAIGITFTMAAPRPIRFFRIAWRAHNVTASLTVQAFEGDVSLADALSLARLQQRRIETA